MPFPAALALIALPQVPGPADPTPELPPTAPVPSFTDLAAGDPELADRGTGRGQLWVDIVGPGLLDPSQPGPPDGVPDLVQLNSNSPALPLGAPPSEWVVPPIGQEFAATAVYRREPDGSLTELAAQMTVGDGPFSLQYPGASPWGAAAGDLDGDGFVDLVTANGGFNIDATNTILLAEGDGTFRDATPAGTPSQASFVATLFDPDRDGDLDLYFGNGTGEIVYFWAGVDDVDPTDRFYANDGTGQFTDATDASGLGLASSTFAAVTTDLDLDGNVDLVASCFKQFNKVFYGRGDGSFDFMRPEGSVDGPPLELTDMAPDPLFDGTVDFPAGVLDDLTLQPIRSLWSMPVEAADFNGDGWTDLFFGTWSYQLADDDATSSIGSEFSPWEPCYLYLNLGDQDGDGRGEGSFRSAATELGVDHVGGVMGAVAGDFNGDGWNDLFIGGGGPDFDQHVEEDFLYLNEPTAWPADFLVDPAQGLTQAFYEVGAVAGTYLNTEMSHGVNVEVSGAGRLDLMVGNGGPAADDQGQANRYLANQGNLDGSPIEAWSVELAPLDATTRAVGTRVELLRQVDGPLGHTLVAERQATHGFSSQRIAPLYVPSGGAPLLFAQARWPGGRRSGFHTWPDGPTGGALVLTEPETSVAVDTLPQPSGGVRLQVGIDHAGATSLDDGVVLLAILPDTPSGPGAPLFVQLTADLDLAPGEDWSLGAQFPNLPSGLYAAVLVEGFEIINQGASWWDGQVLPTSLASYDASGRKRARPGPERDQWVVRRTLTLEAERVVERPQDGGGARHHRPLDRAGRLALPSGASLEWVDGRVTLSAAARPLWVQREPDGAVVALVGAAQSCCETAPTTPATHLRFEGVAPASLRLDGRTARGEPSSATSAR